MSSRPDLIYCSEAVIDNTAPIYNPETRNLIYWIYAFSHVFSHIDGGSIGLGLEDVLLH